MIRRRYPDYASKLVEMAPDITTRRLWIAPAAPGFDARLVGGIASWPRRDGETLRRELTRPRQSSPDAIGVISWNEFSENTYVEPSRAYGSTELKVIADVRGTQPPDVSTFDSDGTGTGTSPLGISYGIVGLVAGCAGLVALTTALRRRRRPPVGPLTKEPSPRL